MTRAACLALEGNITEAIASGTPGDGVLDPVVEWVQGSHPLPDDESVRAGMRAREIADGAKRSGEPLLVLISGGASAMLALPAPGVPLADKRAVIDALLLAGADIGQLNCVRKHLSAIKGGQLAAAAAGRSLTLAISDVHLPEDDPATIGSGPTAADPSTAEEAIAVLDQFGIAAPSSVRSHLAAVRDGRAPETCKSGDPVLGGAVFTVIANRHTAVAGAEAAARRLGYEVHTIETATRGEAQIAGRRLAELTLAMRPRGGPVCVIASGETTVTVTGRGTGGRNQEFVLGAAPVLAASERPVLIASVGTDGIDGPTPASGAVASSTTLARLEGLGIDVADVLARNDAYPALERLGDLIAWGPTLTNVGDVHVVLTMRPC
jgi:hydroxypyruvate reductase